MSMQELIDAVNAAAMESYENIAQDIRVLDERLKLLERKWEQVSKEIERRSER